MEATATAPETTAQIQICLLGGFRLLKDGRQVHLRAGGKVEQVLGTLALGPSRGLPRRDLLSLVWPDSDVPLAGQSLNTLIYTLHKELAVTIGGHHLIVIADERYRLNRTPGVTVDVTAFEAAADIGAARASVGDGQGSAEALEAALHLYAGDLAFGSDIRYLVERERLRAKSLAARSDLAEIYYSQGEIGRALDLALTQLVNDPCREDAHRLAMRCYVRLGSRSQALRQYRTCSALLAREFNAVPERKTDDLYDLIREAPESSESHSESEGTSNLIRV